MVEWKRRAAVLVLAAVVAGCATSPTPTPTPGGSAAAASPGAAATVSTAASLAAVLPSGPISVGPLDPALIALPSTDPQQLAAAAAAEGADVRARVNASAVDGPVAASLETLMDQAETTALQDVVDKLKARTGLGGDGSAVLASYTRPATPTPTPPRMAMLTIGFYLVIVMGGVAVGEFNPKVGDIPPSTLTQTIDKNDGPITMTVTVTLTFSTAAGVLTASINIDGNGSGTDAAGKAVTMTGSSAIVFSINPCPDAGGHVSGTVSIGDDESFTTAGESTIGYKITATTDYVTSVNGQADIDSENFKVQIDRAITTVTPTSPDPSTIDVGLSSEDSLDANGGRVAGQTGSMTLDKADGPVQPSDVTSLAGVVGTFGYGLPIALSAAARDDWRSGRCMEVRPSPNGGDVSTGSSNPVQVKVYHWVDKAEIQVPVKATLTGTASVDPNGQPVTSPATFTFKAGKPASTGDIEFKTTSNRGIAMTTSAFKVRGGLSLDIKGTYAETVGPINYQLRVTATGLVVTVHDDGTVSVSGNVTVKGPVTALGGICHGSVNEKIGVVGTGSITGPDDAPVYRVLIGPASTDKLGETISCPYITAPASSGDFFGQWSKALGQVDLPAAGGVVTRSGSTASPQRQASGTFTATPSS